MDARRKKEIRDKMKNMKRATIKATGKPPTKKEAGEALGVLMVLEHRKDWRGGEAQRIGNIIN